MRRVIRQTVGSAASGWLTKPVASPAVCIAGGMEYSFVHVQISLCIPDSSEFFGLLRFNADSESVVNPMFSSNHSFSLCMEIEQTC